MTGLRLKRTGWEGGPGGEPVFRSLRGSPHIRLNMKTKELQVQSHQGAKKHVSMRHPV